MSRFLLLIATFLRGMLRSRRIPERAERRRDSGPVSDEHGVVVPEAGEDPVARAAVVLLRAIASREPLVADHVLLLPTREILTDRETAARLAAAPKPLPCRVAAVDGVFALTLEPLEERHHRMLADEDVLRALNGGVLGRHGQAALRDAGDDRVLIVGRGESIVLRLAEVERLDREYLPLANYFVNGNRPEDYGFPPGAAAWARRYAPSSSRTIVV